MWKDIFAGIDQMHLPKPLHTMISILVIITIFLFAAAGLLHTIGADEFAYWLIVMGLGLVGLIFLLGTGFVISYSLKPKKYLKKSKDHGTEKWN